MPDKFPEIAALEAALKTLAPAAGPFDRDRLFFRAGKASVRSRRWLWPSVASLLALVAAALGGLLAVRPGPEIVERVVYIREPVKPDVQQPSVPDQPTITTPVADMEPVVAATTAPAAVSGDYLRLREQVVRWGVDALPAPVPFASAGEPLRPTSIFSPSPFKY